VQSLTIIIPAYNEEDHIAVELLKVKQLLDTLDDLSWTVLVVNDGSKDQTGSIVNNISQTDSRIVLIDHSINQGVGAAFYTGLTNVKTEWVFLHPADGQFDICELPNFIALMGKADIMVGYKHEGHKVFHRKILTSINLGLTNLLFQLYLRNVTWVTMYRMSFIDTHILKMRSPVIFTEVLVRAKQKNAEFVEVLTNVWDRQGGKPTAARIMQVAKSVIELIKLRVITLRR
jgi:glycosyltransferase involved in cell wall biosynthesis